MPTLYSLNGGEPTPLLFDDMFDADGKLWKNVRDDPEALEACGLAAAPDKPTFDPATQHVVWDATSSTWTVQALPAPSLAAIKSTAIAAAQDQFATRISSGAPYGGQSVQLDDGSQARITAIGTTALAAASGAVAWPDGYAKGWIPDSGVRIPLPSATDGLTFAATIGGYYANLVQHEHDLEVAIGAATDAAGVAGVDVTAGWPS